MLTENKVWTEFYRPKSIDDVIFPAPEWKDFFNKAIENGKLDGNICLYGKGGLGKTTLADILIKSIIKNQSDFKRIKTRSVEEIETLSEFLTSRPVASKQRIILLEEAELLSLQAQKELKDKYCEKFIDNGIFILTTNFKHKLDPYLLQRFQYKISFDQLDSNLVTERLIYILINENAKFNESELKEYVKNNINMGVRELINTLQTSYKLHDGQIILSDNVIENDLEEKVVLLMLNMINKMLTLTDTKQRRLDSVNPLNSNNIGNEYGEFISLVHNNYNLNYEYIFNNVLNNVKYVPIQLVIINYLEGLPSKMYKNLHCIACLADIFKVITDTII